MTNLRAAMAVALAGCAVATAPMAYAQTIGRATLSGSYTGGSPVYATSDGTARIIYPNEGKFSFAFQYGRNGNGAYLGDGSGRLTNTGGYVPNAELVSFYIDEMRDRVSVYSQNECRCAMEFLVSFDKPQDFIRGYTKNGAPLLTGGRRFQLENVTSKFGGKLFDVTIFGGVPEPTSWALMIGGFGMVGSSFRRRKVTTKVALA